jgi:hypothetical protein
MKTIEDLWQELARGIFVDEISDIQRIEMRRAFYAGATAMFLMLLDVSRSDEAGATRFIKAVTEEIVDWQARLKRSEV